MYKNKAIKQAEDKLNRMSEDEELQRIAELREKAILDERASYDKGLKEGIEEGEQKRSKTRQRRTD